MSNYRIRKSPSGKHYRIQQLKQTFKSLFIRVFFPAYPRQYDWRYVTRVNGDIVEFCAEEPARQLIIEMRNSDMDSDDEKWSIIDV